MPAQFTSGLATPLASRALAMAASALSALVTSHSTATPPISAATRLRAVHIYIEKRDFHAGRCAVTGDFSANA